MASSVLAYIDAGLLVLAGLLLLIGASAVDTWNDAFGNSDQGFTAELATDGLINLLSAGLQIAGGVMMSSRNLRGRTLFSVGAGLCVLAGLYWLVRVHNVNVAIWTAVFVGLPIIALVHGVDAARDDLATRRRSARGRATSVRYLIRAPSVAESVRLRRRPRVKAIVRVLQVRGRGHRADHRNAHEHAERVHPVEAGGQEALVLWGHLPVGQAPDGAEHAPRVAPAANGQRGRAVVRVGDSGEQADIFGEAETRVEGRREARRSRRRSG